VNSSQIDDKVLMKSDGMPTYHLANVVDDYLMKISHVIRGEEWLPSAPLHVLLYKSLGWEQDMPCFAHLPLLLKPDGNGKLSKRDADKMGFPIFPLDWVDPRTQEYSQGFKEKGYLPDALLNFLAFLGWNPGTTQELFTISELIEVFELGRINKAGARFDIHKAQWYNQQYLRNKSDDELAGYLLRSLQERGLSCEKIKAISICRLLKDRITFPQDLVEMGMFFFAAPETYDEKTVAKKWTGEIVKVLTEYRNGIQGLSTFTTEQAKAILEEVTASMNTGTGKVMQPLRVTITGGLSGPDLMASMAILGPHEVSKRISRAIEVLEVKPD
jgi:glutamyl-tRNA synthetase